MPANQHKCSKCGSRKHTKRLSEFNHIRHSKGKFSSPQIAIGWICHNCGNIEVTDEVPNFRIPSRIPLCVNCGDRSQVKRVYESLFKRRDSMNQIIYQRMGVGWHCHKCNHVSMD